MKTVKEFVLEQIGLLVPRYEKLEFEATVGDTMRAIEFFVTVDGERKQCYDMSLNGEIDEVALDKAGDEIARYYRSTPEFVKGKLNTVSFVIEK